MHFPGGLLHRRRRTGVEPLKVVIFHLVHFTDIVRCVAFGIIVINGFLLTQRQKTLKDIGLCEYIMLENFIRHVCRTFS